MRVNRNMERGNDKTSPPKDDFHSTLEKYEKALIIDKNDLDTALEQQPDFFYRVAELLALLISKRDAAKQNIMEVEAAVDIKIRDTFKEIDKKTTEGEIASLKATDNDVIRAKGTLAILSSNVGRASALKEAFSQRGDALKGLVALYNGNYWSDASSGAGRAAVRNRDAEDVKNHRKER